MACTSCGSPLAGMHYSFCSTRQGGTVGPYEVRSIPEQETRGGNRVDWAQAKPGEPLPELPPEDYPEPDSESTGQFLLPVDPDSEDE